MPEPTDLDRLRDQLAEIEPGELAAIVRTLARGACRWLSFEVPRHTCNTDTPDVTCAVCMVRAALTRVGE